MNDTDLLTSIKHIVKITKNYHELLSTKKKTTYLLKQLVKPLSQSKKKWFKDFIESKSKSLNLFFKPAFSQNKNSHISNREVEKH